MVKDPAVDDAWCADKRTIALIGSPLLFESLQPEVNVLLLTRANCVAVLACYPLDFILLEPSQQQMTADWQSVDQPQTPAHRRLLALLCAAREHRVATVFWQTDDHQYCDLYRPLADGFDRRYCADPQAVDFYQARGLAAALLPPAVQPKLFTAYGRYGDHAVYRDAALICDGLGQYALQPQAWDELRQALGDFQLNLFESFESTDEPLLAQANEAADIRRLGFVAGHNKRALLSQAQIYLDDHNSRLSTTRRQWLALQAASAGTLVIVTELLPDGDIRNSIGLTVDGYRQLARYLTIAGQDPLFVPRLVQQYWRKAVSEHTFGQRIDQILADLNLTQPRALAPKASLIMPTKRPAYVERAIAQYDAQNYANKELVIVFNGNHDVFTEYQEKLECRSDIRLLYAPEEKYAAWCMNIGIAAARGAYIFRFDDDDWYGKNYLPDMMLHLTISQSDFIGKPLVHFQRDTEPKLFKRDNHDPQYLLHFAAKALSHDAVFISGSTISGKKDTFIRVPYPEVTAAADSAWYQAVNQTALCGLVADRFNAVFWRRTTDDSHSWKMSESCSPTQWIKDDFFV